MAAGVDTLDVQDTAISGDRPAAEMVELAPQVRLGRVISRFWPMIRPYRGYLVLIALMVALSPALTAATTWLFKVMVDEVVVPGDLARFPQLAGLFAALALAAGAVSFGDFYLTIWTGQRFVLSLRSRLFKHLHRLTPDFLERRALGDVLARITTDVDVIEQLLLAQLSQLLSYIFELVFFTAALFLLDWRLAAASLIASPAILVMAQKFATRIQHASREKGRRAGGTSGVAEESLSNAALVRAYDRADAEHDKFDEQNQAGFTAQMSASRLQAMFGPLAGFVQTFGVLVVFGLAAWEISHHHITIGGFIAFITYLGQLYRPIQSIGSLINSIFAASASAERVIELLDQEPSITEADNPRELARARGALNLRNVTFTYPGNSDAALADLSLTVEPGQKIAVVGGSGAGKSTLTKLLLRFYDPDQGSLSLDGIDLRELRLADLYRNVSTVFQESLVFDGTVAENIAWGNPEASQQAVVDAAIAADAHDFILGLPDKYDTRVGQRGRLLSGGQRQRLAIARALVRDAPVLILDEPTTGLDGESTERLLAPLRRLMAGRTTIIISHNLRTVTDADQIVYLDKGRITAVGTHDELLGGNSAYASLYRLSVGSPASMSGR